MNRSILADGNLARIAQLLLLMFCFGILLRQEHSYQEATADEDYEVCRRQLESLQTLAGTDDHAATDDHATDDHAIGHPSLFEAISFLKPVRGTAAIIFVILFILVLKYMFEFLHHITHDTSFSGMVTKIEEELMIVGTSAFLFKIVLNTTDFSSNEWAFPLEFGELLVPMLAFTYCGIGILMVFYSLQQCQLWSKAHHLKLVEILDDYFNDAQSWTFR